MGLFGRKYYDLNELSESEKKTMITALKKLGEADASLDCSTLIASIEKGKLNKVEMNAAREIAKFYREKVVNNPALFTSYDAASAEKTAGTLKKIEDLITSKIG